jgi:RimJ/RimL family protein N-acetyltransferase
MAFDSQPTLVGKLVVARPLRADDHAALYTVASDPLIWEQHPEPERYKPAVFDKLFAESLDSGGALIVHDAAMQALIGSSRYHGYDEGLSEVEIGWTFLARSHWGGRYNGELKRLMLEHAFRFVESVIFYIGPDNLRSQRALHKVGGIPEPARDEPGRLCYRIRRPQWQGNIDRSHLTADKATPR